MKNTSNTEQKLNIPEIINIVLNKIVYSIKILKDFIENITNIYPSLVPTMKWNIVVVDAIVREARK